MHVKPFLPLIRLKRNMLEQRPTIIVGETGNAAPILNDRLASEN